MLTILCVSAIPLGQKLRTLFIKLSPRPDSFKTPSRVDFIRILCQHRAPEFPKIAKKSKYIYIYIYIYISAGPYGASWPRLLPPSKVRVRSPPLGGRPPPQGRTDGTGRTDGRCIATGPR